MGENLYYSFGMSVDQVPSVAVKKWYDEIVDHNYNNPRFDFKTGHFTQVSGLLSDFHVQLIAKYI